MTELAEEWHRKLTSDWKETQQNPHEGSPFLFTTNDALNNFNAKLRSNKVIPNPQPSRHSNPIPHFHSNMQPDSQLNGKDRAIRGKLVREAYARGGFSYSKWELGTDECHPEPKQTSTLSPSLTLSLNLSPALNRAVNLNLS